MSTVLAQAPDLSGVEGDFVKSWMIVAGFVVIIGLQVWDRASGRRVQRREVSGELVTRAEVPLATKAELDELERKIDGFVEENRTQHHEAVEAGRKRVQDLSTVFEDRLRIVADKIDVMVTRMSERFESLARHDEKLQQLEKRHEALEERHADAVKKLHERVNDAMERASARGGGRTAK